MARGVYMGLAFKEMLLNPVYNGNVLVEELEQMIASYNGALQNVVEARKSELSKETKSTLGSTLVVSNVTQKLMSAGTAEETLMSVTIPANTLDKNGQGLEITAFGTYAANANSKQVRLYFGNTVLSLSPLQALISHKWTARATVLRRGPSSQTAVGDINITLDTASTNYQFTNVTAPTEPFGAPILVKVTGQVGAGGLGNIVADGLIIKKVI